MCHPYIESATTLYNKYGDKHTRTRQEIEISPPNLSEAGSLCSPIQANYLTSEYPLSKLLQVLTISNNLM